MLGCANKNEILCSDPFGDIGGPRLCTRHVMNKNGLIFPMCSSMTLRKGFELGRATKEKKYE